jgi:hypothetical protein
VQLRPTVVQIIRTAVTSANADTVDTNGLVETIIIQLKPVVLSSVQSAIATSGTPEKWNADQLSQTIILELTPFVQGSI